MLPSLSDNDDALAEKFRQFVKNPDFPCLSAKAALTKGQLHFVIAADLRSNLEDARIHRMLLAFVQRYQEERALFSSFVVVFREPDTLDERAFERHLWRRLQSLTDLDTCARQPVDHRVSTDPSDAHFALSFGGEAFYAVGLHPHANRPARRFSHPAIVLNAHDQFEELRRRDLYAKLKEQIRAREVAFSGSANPMLREFGETSEAPQYSGRIVGDEWKCPFHRRRT